MHRGDSLQVEVKATAVVKEMMMTLMIPPKVKHYNQKLKCDLFLYCLYPFVQQLL